MTPLRLGVVGAGSMGRLHARAIARRAARVGDCVLARVVDRSLARSEGVVSEFGGWAGDELETCFGEVDAAVVATPTRLHGEVTRSLLARDIDVLVEKPMAASVAEAKDILRMAQDRGLILAVGHIEWHNVALREAIRRAGVPRRIEVERLNPSIPRGLDIDVVQDFMLHDLDWVMRLVRDEIVDLEASGRAVSNEGLDEAEAKIRFASGCQVRLHASRVHSERTRNVRIEGSQATVELDLLVAEKTDAKTSSERPGQESEPLDVEWADFIAACRSRKAPENDGAVGVAAIELVERVRRAIARSGEGPGRDDDPPVCG